MILGNLESLHFFRTELLIGATVIALFLADLLVSGRNHRLVAGAIATFGSLFAFYFAAGEMVAAPSGLFGGLVAGDAFTGFFKLLILLTTLLIIPIAMRDSETNRLSQGEFYALLLSMALGGMVLAASTNLLMTYLSLELVSLVSYVLAGYLKEDRRSSEASMKYVIYGGVASGAMVYGMSLLYGLTGSMEFAAIGQSLSQAAPMPAFLLTLFLSSLLILAGFGYKVACVPFHMWCPDVYEGSPTPVTAYFSVVPKVAGFAALTRFFYGALSVPVEATGFAAIHQVEWPMLLAALAAATMTLGNLVAIHQTSLKRLLAYSSIAHAGYVLMALVVLTRQGVAAILFYLAVYLVMNLGAFLVVILVREATGSDHIDQFKGLGVRGGHATFVAICMTVFLFSLTGIPPTAGFVGKVYLFAAVVHEKWYWLATIGVLNSVVSLYYYARILRAMFFDQGPALNLYAGKWLGGGRLQPIYMGLLIALVGLTLFFGLYWSPLAILVEGPAQVLALQVGK